MREIKFRIWCHQQNEMFSVKNLKFDNNELWCAEYYENEAPYFFDNKDWELMQYTGLKDKNGIEIYERDILKFKHLYNYSNEFQIVSMKEHSWGTNDFEFWEIIRRGYEFEVVGNIYENLELLK